MGIFSAIKNRIEAGAERSLKQYIGSPQAAPSYYGNSGYLWPSTALPSSGLDWRAMAGDVLKNSAVSVAVNWARRNFIQAPPQVVGIDSDELIEPHDLTRLLFRPNRYYSGRTLWEGSILSWIHPGNVYWLKVRDRADRVAELWYLPHFRVTPKMVAGVLVYEYWDGQKRTTFAARDIVHLRNGLDPDNPLLGLSPLAYCLREVATDNECTVYDASILRNMGVPGAIISPRVVGDHVGVIDEAGAAQIKALYVAKTSGDRRGEPLVFPNPLDVTTLGATPEQMALDKIRRVPEARIAGAIGIPAMVLGLAVGENQRTYANMREAREAAAEEFLIPLYDSIADDLDVQLLGVWDDAARNYVPELGDPARERVQFDITKLRMLAQDENEIRRSWGDAFRNGGVTLNEFRDKIGLEPLGKPKEDGTQGEGDDPRGSMLYFDLVAAAKGGDAGAGDALSSLRDADGDGQIQDPQDANEAKALAVGRNGAR